MKAPIRQKIVVGTANHNRGEAAGDVLVIKSKLTTILKLATPRVELRLSPTRGRFLSVYKG